MIEIEALTPENLAAFEPESPLPAPIPEKHFGHAAAFVEDGKPLAICLVVENDGAAEVGLIMSAAARRYPVSLHRLAKSMLTGLHMSGYQRIRTGADNPRSARWLRRLGFHSVDGVFEKCLS